MPRTHPPPAPRGSEQRPWPFRPGSALHDRRSASATLLLTKAAFVPTWARSRRWLPHLDVHPRALSRPGQTKGAPHDRLLPSCPRGHADARHCPTASLISLERRVWLHIGACSGEQRRSVFGETRRSTSAASRARRLVNEDRFVATWTRDYRQCRRACLISFERRVWIHMRGIWRRAASWPCPTRIDPTRAPLREHDALSARTGSWPRGHANERQCRRACLISFERRVWIHMRGIWRRAASWPCPTRIDPTRAPLREHDDSLARTGFVATWARRLTAIPNGLLHQQLSGIFCSARGHAARAASCRCPRRTGAARESASRARRLSLTRATCVPTWARRRNGDGERLLWSAPRAARLAPHAGQVAASSVMTGSDENRRCTSAASRPRRFRWRGPGSCPRGHAD
jgi:hypothetical protein